MAQYKLHIDGLTEELSEAQVDALDLVQRDSALHCVHLGQTYQGQLVSLHDKEITLKVNGNLYTITIEDELDQLVDRMGLNAEKEVILKDIKAPMPGLILEILVKNGQSIKPGDPILILSAMKMENIIKAEGAGIVKEILLDKGATVEKSQVIIEME